MTRPRLRLVDADREKRLAAKRRRRKRHYTRVCQGLIVLSIEVSQERLVDALVQSNRLSESDTALTSRERLQQELQGVIEDFIQEFTPR